MRLDRCNHFGCRAQCHPERQRTRPGPNGSGQYAGHRAGSGDGNATIFFDATNIRSIRFTYSGSSLFADPTYQHIGIDYIQYIATPEANPGWLCAFGCGSWFFGRCGAASIGAGACVSAKRGLARPPSLYRRAVLRSFTAHSWR